MVERRIARCAERSRSMKTPLRSHLPWLLVSAVLTLTLALAGCAGHYGSIRLDAGIGQDFRAAQILPAHRYYYAGSALMPDAILALRDDHPLRSNLWHEVPATRERLARLVEGMRGSREDGPYGSAILDDHGVRIGIWCSYLRPLPVKLLEDGGVIVSPPVPEWGDPSIMQGFGVD
jgi:hypothetical protein